MVMQPVEWIDAGEPMDALRTMLSLPVVSTQEFHRVYARILDSDLADNPVIRDIFDDLLHMGGPYDQALMHEGKICTVGGLSRFRAPEEVIAQGEAACAAWCVKNIPVEHRFS